MPPSFNFSKRLNDYFSLPNV